MNKKIAYLLLFLAVFYFAEKYCAKATDGFSVSSITSETPLAYETLGSQEEARSILNQTFTYLGHGGQSFVFASADGKYILKFFNNHPKAWIPLSKYRAKKMQKLDTAYFGYRLAYKEILNESGLIFLHLNKFDFHSPVVTIVDKLNISHKLDLNSVEFVIQKRAEPVQDYLRKHPHEAIASMKQLISLLGEKNIHDHDPRIYRNMGFVDGKAILIDPGKCVTANERESKFPEKFREWIDANFPELSKDIQ